MDLQTRKLNAIGYLIELKDEKIFSKIELTILENQTHPGQNKKNELKPLTQQQLIERAKLSNKDYLTGRYKTQEQLELESKNW